MHRGISVGGSDWYFVMSRTSHRKSERHWTEARLKHNRNWARKMLSHIVIHYNAHCTENQLTRVFLLTLNLNSQFIVIASNSFHLTIVLFASYMNHQIHCLFKCDYFHFFILIAKFSVQGGGRSIASFHSSFVFVILKRLFDLCAQKNVVE